MKVKKDYGSKEKLFEMFQKVNNIKKILNEEESTEIINADDENQEDVPALDVNDVDNDGEKLEGGLGDNKDILTFEPSQILMGMEVEMEHTKDPDVALEITKDHLTEDPEYYTKLKDMEAGSCDNESEEDNEKHDELADELLGYKSFNAGDSVE